MIQQKITKKAQPKPVSIYQCYCFADDPWFHISSSERTSEWGWVYLEVQSIADVLGCDRKIVVQKVRRDKCAFNTPCFSEDKEKDLVVAPIDVLFSYMEESFRRLKKRLDETEKELVKAKSALSVQ